MTERLALVMIVRNEGDHLSACLNRMLSMKLLSSIQAQQMIPYLLQDSIHNRYIPINGTMTLLPPEILHYLSLPANGFYHWMPMRY